VRAAPKAAALAIALTPSATAARAGDYRIEIKDQVIEPCFLQLARQGPAMGRSPEAMARAMMLHRADGLVEVVEAIDRQLAGDPPSGGGCADPQGRCLGAGRADLRARDRAIGRSSRRRARSATTRQSWLSRSRGPSSHRASRLVSGSSLPLPGVRPAHPAAPSATASPATA